MRFPRGLGVVLVSVAACVPVRAQDAPASHRVGYTAGLAGTYGNLAGGDFGGSKAAVGFEVNAGVVLRRWQLGVGYDRTTHGHEKTDGDFIVSNVFLEPRLMFADAGRSWTPYAAARLGRAMASYEGVLGLTDKGTGYLAGIGAGLLWAITSGVQGDAAAHYARLSHDYGTGDYAAAEKGGRTSVRLGVRIGPTR